jgi:hypothetical protein
MLIIFRQSLLFINPGLFNPTAQTFMIEKSWVEKFRLALGLKMPWLKCSGLKNSFLLWGPGLKVEKSGVEISCSQNI